MFQRKDSGHIIRLTLLDVLNLSKSKQILDQIYRITGISFLIIKWEFYHILKNKYCKKMKQFYHIN